MPEDKCAEKCEAIKKMCKGKDGKPSESKADKTADVKAKMQASTAQAGQNAKQFLAKMGSMIEGSSTVKQLAVGAASGW